MINLFYNEVKVGESMIKRYLLNNIYYLTLSMIAFALLSISSIYLLNNPTWDVQNWYVIAFSNSIITLVILQIPLLLHMISKIKFDVVLTNVFYIFLFLTLIVGEAIGVYRITAFYDSLIHAMGGFVLSLLAYYVFKSLTKERSKLLMILFILGFQALFGTVWEIFEFALDSWIGSNTQSYFDDLTQTLFLGQAALKDTMFDFLFNTLGSLIFVFALPKINVYFIKKTE